MTDLTTTQFARRTALGLAGASGLAFLWPTAASAREFDRPYEGFAPPNTTLRAATAASVGLNQARIRRRLRSRPGRSPSSTPRSRPTHSGRASLPVVTGEATLSRLRSLRSTLPPAEVRVADLVLSDARRVASLTITQLAAEAATSETSVLRFARRLGLAGYPGLRLALVEAAAAERDRDRDRGTRRLTDVSDSDTLDDIVEKVAHAGAAAVEDTARRLSRTTLAAVAEAFTAARRVDLFGVAASGLVAADLQLKLHQIGIATHAWTDAHLALTSVSLLGPGDVALVFSHSGTTVEAVEVLEAAKAAGATAVAITNAERSPVAKAADLVLLTSGNETNQRSAATASRIGALTVVDILFLATAQLNLPAATRAVAATKRAVAAHHRSR